jgi:hypothetical protein
VVAERGTAEVVAPGAERGHYLREGPVGRCKKMDLPYASTSGSTVLGAVEGDRTIGACASVLLGSFALQLAEAVPWLTPAVRRGSRGRIVIDEFIRSYGAISTRYRRYWSLRTQSIVG